MSNSKKSTEKSSNRMSKSKTHQKNNKKSIEDQLLETYEGIISRHETNEAKFFCIVCNEQKSPFFTGFWHNCKEHLSSKSHNKAIQKASCEDSEMKLPDQSENYNDENLNEENTEQILKLLTPEIKGDLDLEFSKFILQYRLPFSIASPLNAFIQQILGYYPIEMIQNYTVNRRTVTSATYSICETLREEIFLNLKSSPFSLSLDASSDAYGYSYLAICARYMELGYDRTVTKLITILPLTTSSTGKTIFNMIMEKVPTTDEIKRNCMEVVTDDGSNMTGVEKGVSSRLKEVCPHIIDMKDISHILHNVFKKSLEALPKSLIEIIKSIPSHFNRSPQRKALLRQKILEKQMEPLEMLHLSATRWLSMRDCIDRIQELWPALRIYFIEYGTEAEKKLFYCRKRTFHKYTVSFVA